MPSKTPTAPDPNEKNIILRNPVFPNQVRRARKSELKWFADRGWLPAEVSVPAGPKKSV